MSVPDLSPLVAAPLVCHKCGQPLKMKVIMGKRGQQTVTDHLEYTCINPKTGCRYRINSYQMQSSEMVALRDDGSEVRIGE